MNDDAAVVGEDAVQALSLGGALLGFEPATGRLALTNESGLALWRALATGATPTQAAAELAPSFDVSIERLRSDLEELELALEATATAGTLPPGPMRPILDPLPWRPFVPRARAVQRYADGEVEIVSESFEVLERLAGMSGDVCGPVETVVVASAGGRTCLRVWRENGRYPIEHVRDTLDTGLDPVDAAARLARICATLHAARDGWVAALHAAAVHRNDVTVLLPAIGGSGKSTLAARLVADGWLLVNDDQAILREPDLMLAAAPFPISIKSDSVAPLRPFFGDLGERPERTDRAGRRVRDLAIGAAGRVVGPVVADTLVAPRWSAEAGRATLIPLTQEETFAALTAPGFAMRAPVIWSDVEALVGWFTRLPCHRLDYSDLDEAVELLAAHSSALDGKRPR